MTRKDFEALPAVLFILGAILAGGASLAGQSDAQQSGLVLMIAMIGIKVFASELD